MYDKLMLIKKMRLEWLSIPETHLVSSNSRILIQRYIKGESLEPLKNIDYFINLKKEFNNQKKSILGISSGKSPVLQARNLVRDKDKNLWLVDPD